MKLGIVVPRFGPDIIGGAEKVMLMYAERLVAQHSWQVEVFTTCALSALTWENVYEPGDSVYNGVTIHRFASIAGRDPEWGSVASRVDQSPTTVDEIGQHLFVNGQGPLCPDVIDAAEASANDLIVFSPYLFYPAVMGIPRLGNRSILHGTAHDEPALRLDIMQHMYGAVGALVYNTDAERILVERLFPVKHKPHITLGHGIEDAREEAVEPDQTADDRLAVQRAVLEQFGLGDRRYVVCVGRVENGKGVRTLDAFFREYKRRRPGDLALVFVGPANERLDDHPDIVVTDVVEETVKRALVSRAEVSISPSAMESFSMVVLEAWVAGTPVLVNARCGATVEHASRAGGGLWFDGYVSFEVALDRLLDDADLRDELAANGAAYATEHFSWNVILDGYTRFCRRLLAHRG